MKKRLFKIAVVILLSFSIYTTFHVADTKCAKAAYCPWQYIDPTVVGGAIANFGAALVQNFYDGVVDFLESYVETKEEEMEETEENLESVAREERLGEVEQGKQLANIAEASVALKKVTEQQVDEYNSIARDFPAPSDQTCFNTNASIQLARADRHAEFKKAVLRERDRHRDGKTVGSRASRGPVILNRVLKEGSQENCLKGEQKGSTDAFCENETDEATADLHKQPSALFTNGATITPEMEDAADLAEEMINPTLKAGPFPQAIKNDPATQAAYMEAKRQEAIYNTSGEVLRDLRARAMPIEGDCEASKKMVKEVFRRRYGNDYVAGIGDGCPSVATIEKAEALRLTNSADMAETITDANGNVYQSDLYLASLDLRQGFDAYQRELDLTLTTVIDKLQERQYADAPIGSIGQSGSSGGNGGGGNNNPPLVDPPPNVDFSDPDDLFPSGSGVSHNSSGGPDGPLDTTNSDCVGLLPENPLTTISLDVDVNGGWNPNYSGRPADGATVDIEWDLDPSESCTIEVGPNVNLTETINGSTGQVSFTFPGGSPLQYVLTCDLSCVPGRWHRIAQTSQ